MHAGIAVCSSLILLLVLGCTAQAEVSAEEWKNMTREERLLTVKSLLGGEVAADAKGGSGGRYPESAERYVERVDALYADGDRRPLSEVWKALESR